MKKLFLSFTFLISILFFTACQTAKSLVGTESEKKAIAEQNRQEALSDKFVRFSDNQNVMSPAQRQYHRMTRSQMEEDSELHAQAGSMWVMDGQGAYLFSQNKTRKEGDLLNVKIEGNAQKQVETKVSVIRKLLKQLEEEQKKAQESEQRSLAQADSSSNPQDAKAAQMQKEALAQRNPASDKDDEKVEIDLVPTRIVERNADGTYRVKGAQPFMIGKREYKVIVMGMIRPEDYNDEGISSNKLLDPQFDVVSLRRKSNDGT